MRWILRGIILSVGFFLIWQTIVSFWQIPNYLLPAPEQVILTLYQQKQLIASQALTTIIEILLGFILGIALGCVAGCTIAFFRPLAFWFLPILIISQAIPSFAIAPLIVVWLGYGLTSKIAVTLLMVFFPVASALYDGLRQTHPDWIDLAHTMHAQKWRIFCFIRFPAALPAFASGIRIAAVAAPIGAIVGEWVGSSRGLGYLMLNANARLQIDMMFAALFVIILQALVLYFIVDRILRKLEQHYSHPL